MASEPCITKVPGLFNLGYTKSVNTRAFAMGIHTERRAERVLICKFLHGHWLARERMTSSGSISKPISASCRVSGNVRPQYLLPVCVAALAPVVPGSCKRALNFRRTLKCFCPWILYLQSEIKALWVKKVQLQRAGAGVTTNQHRVAQAESMEVD